MDDHYLYAGDHTSPSRFEGRGCLVATLALIIVAVAAVAIGCAATGRPMWATTFGLITVILFFLTNQVTRE